MTGDDDAIHSLYILINYVLIYIFLLIYLTREKPLCDLK